MFNDPEIIEAINNIEKGVSCGGLSDKTSEIISIFRKNLEGSTDKEEIYDVSIDALNRIGNDFSFIAIFREDRKYSTAVRIRVDSELVNRVEDYARKIMPELTVMRYRIPIYEDGRLFRRFLLDGKVPLVSDNINLSDGSNVLKASITEMYDNLISFDSPLKLLIPAFKRMVPYKSAMSVQLFINDFAVGNIGFASRDVLSEESLNFLLMISSLMSDKLEKLGFGKNYNW